MVKQDARPHTAARTMAKFEELGCEMLVYPPYSPDLAPSDFHIFRPLKNHMRGKHFTTYVAVIDAVRKWFRAQPPKFYSAGIENLVGSWNKCIEKKRTVEQKEKNVKLQLIKIKCYDKISTTY